MSERKVLNKYYPPDFDPSKIPRGKGGRNKTFTIRLMAPCNMRCKTCGEYIYKGRKFNARKEDVDDMSHLGLRIYRFYIRCTACLSEISFRTDPANTDYVLEAGATRNFEALSKAEKLAEESEKAYQEELKNNPMKLLEERTEASKNEMERMEALEELQELNKREIKVNYDSLLSTFDKQREAEAKLEEEDDEEFVRSIFSHGQVKMKRILDVEDQTSSGESSKMLKVGNEVNDTGRRAQASWNKSVGCLDIKKGTVLVKKKPVQKLSAQVSKPSGSLALVNYDSDDSKSE